MNEACNKLQLLKVDTSLVDNDSMVIHFYYIWKLMMKYGSFYDAIMYSVLLK